MTRSFLASCLNNVPAHLLFSFRLSNSNKIGLAVKHENDECLERSCRLRCYFYDGFNRCIVTGCRNFFTDIVCGSSDVYAHKYRPSGTRSAGFGTNTNILVSGKRSKMNFVQLLFIHLS